MRVMGLDDVPPQAAQTAPLLQAPSAMTDAQSVSSMATAPIPAAASQPAPQQQSAASSYAQQPYQQPYQRANTGILFMLSAAVPAPSAQEVCPALLDSGAFMHVCPPTFAPQYPIEPLDTRAKAFTVSGESLEAVSQN